MASSCVRAARMTSRVRTSLRTRPKTSRTTNTATLPMAAAMNCPTPQQMPQMMAQKMYVVSRASLMAVRKRTMDRAPTMPRDSAMLFPMTVMTVAVSTVSVIRLMLNFCE